MLKNWRDSLRIRLLIGTAVVTTAIFIAAAVALYLLVRAQLIADLSTTLTAEARAVSAGFELTDKGAVDIGDTPFDAIRKSDQKLGSDEALREYAQIWSADGQVLARSPALGKNNLPIHLRGFSSPAILYTTLPNGDSALAVAITVTLKAETDEGAGEKPASKNTLLPPSSKVKQTQVTLAIARDMDPINDTLGDLSLWLILIWAIAIVVEMVALALVITGGLRYTKVLAGQVGRIDETDLSTRIQMRRVPAELSVVVHRLNDLLARVQAAFAHEKAFLGQVAHELRTPLAGLRSILEVSLSRQRSAKEYKKDMRDVLAISYDMQDMVNNLLALARLDAGQAKTVPKKVAVHQLIIECANQQHEIAASKNLSWDRWIQKPLFAVVDSQRLQIVLRNLFNNAVTYAPKQTTIRIKALSNKQTIHLEIANEGCQIRADEADKVFERFWRGSQSGDDSSGHSGLGLALCKQLIEHLGGTIRARCTKGGLFQIVITLDVATQGQGKEPGKT